MLGVSRDADQKAIKDAFRTLALKYHPDRNKESGAEERFKEIAEAYAILSDPGKRAEYNARGFAGVEGFSREDLFSGINFDDIFGGAGFDLGGGLFDMFFHRQHRAGPRRGADIEVELVIPLERVAEGGDAQVRIARPVVCHACHGTGAAGGAAPRTCPACKGSGRITRSSRQEKEHVLIQQIATCPDCQGRGSIIDQLCPQCRGSGEESKDEDLTVRIPAGVEEGMALRIAGKGMPGEAAGGAAGDLLVIVRSRPDPRFERAGADLLRQESIALTDAVLGTTLHVPTLHGNASVTIPPGTQPGSVLRLKGKGLPEYGSSRHGELYLRIDVKIPEHLTREERELYERLRALAASGGR